eukprot:403362843
MNSNNQNIEILSPSNNNNDLNSEIRNQEKNLLISNDNLAQQKQNAKYIENINNSEIQTVDGQSQIDRSMQQSVILNSARQQPNFKVNLRFLIGYILVSALGLFQLGYILSENNQVSVIFDVQFNLKNQSERNFYHTMIGSSAVLGAVIGSLFGGKIITQFGRRKAMIYCNIFAAFFVMICMYENFYTICLGRLLYGFCGGIFQVALPRIIDETVPFQYQSTFGVVSPLVFNGGQMLGIVMGAGLPSSDDINAEQKTQFWRIIYGLPWIFQFITLVSYLVYFKYESIKYLIDNQRDFEAIEMIKLVYDRSEDPQQILKYIKMTSSSGEENRVSFKEALFGENYWRASWFCFIFAVINQLTGINAIVWYSSAILKRMQQSGGALSPKNGTILIGVVNFLGTCCAIFSTKRFGRKTLVLAGHLIMGTQLFLVGLFSLYELNNAMLTMILGFLITFQMTDGPVLFIYGSEVTVDQGFGFVVFGIKSTGLLISLTTEYLMDSSLQPHGAFWLYSSITFLGFIYFYFLMKETLGLTDREKKEIYRKKAGVDTKILMDEFQLENQQNDSEYKQQIDRDKDFNTLDTESI